ncbi:aspartate kinase [Pelagibacterales bacterium SAG-MED32]|nr:aspartate kinase [Pelagibacterales bacterium SAG-MED32]
MSTLVLKFGGTSVATTKLIESAAKIVKSEYDKNNNIVVVVSAMSGTTNSLIDHVNSIDFNDDSEYDLVVSSGEQITAGLMSLALKKLNVPARSWLGWQIPIITRGQHRNAFIDKIVPDGIVNDFKEKKVAVVAGFQGISSEERITTIGRGGSDNTAVFLAAAVAAERCDIYTDVDGVYTSDPKMTEKVRRLDKISYEEMIEMASQGAKVLQTTSVESAMNHDVNVNVRSTFNPSDEGTQISNDVSNETRAVTGVAYSKDEAKITIIDVEDKPGVAAEIFKELASSSVNVDMIVQNNFIERKMTNITFTVPMTDLKKSLGVLEELKKIIVFSKVLDEQNLSKVSIIGSGMRNQPGIAAKMFDCLSNNNINIEVISTSEIKISVLIDRNKTEAAVNALHSVFNLDKI